MWYEKAPHMVWHYILKCLRHGMDARKYSHSLVYMLMSYYQTLKSILGVKTMLGHPAYSLPSLTLLLVGGLGGQLTS